MRRRERSIDYSIDLPRPSGELSLECVTNSAFLIVQLDKHGGVQRDEYVWKFRLACARFRKSYTSAFSMAVAVFVYLLVLAPTAPPVGPPRAKMTHFEAALQCDLNAVLFGVTMFVYKEYRLRDPSV